MRADRHLEVSCVQAVITDVSDPLNNGRCKVQLRNFTAADSSISYVTDWCSTITTTVFKGQLPKLLVGKKVLAFPINQSYEQLAINLSSPLVYGEGEVLPEPGLDNLGLKIIRVNGPEAFCSVCLLRNGVYAWIDNCDLRHGHATGDTQDQDNDSGGDFQMSIEQLVTHDSVFSTAINPYIANSGFVPSILTA